MRIASSPVHIDTSALAKLYVAEAVKMLHRVAVDGSIHRDAERLLMRLGDRIALRAADTMHLALATRSEARSFVTFDRRLTSAARVHGEFDPPTA